MALNFEQLQNVWNLHKRLDDLLESFQFNYKDMTSANQEIFTFLQREIGIKALFIETKNEKLINSVFTYGDCNEDLKLRAPQMCTINQVTTFTLGGSLWFAQPIDVDNKVIGTIAMAFQKHQVTNTEYYSELLNTTSELLDSFFYGIHRNSVKHSMIMGLQDALADLDIGNALNKATSILYQCFKFKHLLIVYDDRGIITNCKNVKYILYNKDAVINDNVETPSATIDRIIRSNADILSIPPGRLCDLLEFDNLKIAYLTKSMDTSESIGFLAIETEKHQSLSTLAQELLQIFSEELRQRLVDLNREKNILRKYFPNPVISRLITTYNYEEHFLKARDEKIGIIFADFSGFTKISEQVLKTPERITSFINKWAKGVVARVFPLSATLDKLIGDCLMLLFGPPFYEDPPATIVKHMLQASSQIVKYTNYFLNLPENADIKIHPEFKNFGIAIGVNYCRCIVGLIGANHDLTAFSSGVNTTARLQSLATANEILVSESVKEIASDNFSKCEFSEKRSTKVKNIEQPLGYYKLTAINFQ